MPPKQTNRAQFTTLSRYSRPLSEGKMESWEDIATRVKKQQTWLWERQLGRDLNDVEQGEIQRMYEKILCFKMVPAGRTLWLGGTELAKRRESCQFNCSFLRINSLYDVVDALWLLLQGTGVGFRPVIGGITGFKTRLKCLEIIRSERTEKGGMEYNVETYDASSKTWTIKLGDSAEAWAKFIGKLLKHPYKAENLVLDFSEIRPAGLVLSGYGWRCSGDQQLAATIPKIVNLLNSRVDQSFSRMDILDLMNLLGTILSSRRSAEIAIMDYGEDEWREFAEAKRNFWERFVPWTMDVNFGDGEGFHRPAPHNLSHRQMSNNTLCFRKKPSRDQIVELFEIMARAGGSEPGFMNMEGLHNRFPEGDGANPCFEILLPDKGFCNLSEVNLPAHKGDFNDLLDTVKLCARMNYRQTMVSFRDGILQEKWDTNNEFYRLCGVSLTGVCQCPELKPHHYRALRNTANHSAYQMAEEVGEPRPKNVTCIKPSGTISKILGTDVWGEVTEGVHKPLGARIFNNITLSKHDPLVGVLRSRGYHIIEKPFEPESVLVRFPVRYEGIEFETREVGLPDGTRSTARVNVESALVQLQRNKMLMDNWCDHNVSHTISYSPEEVPEIIDWLMANWDSYVGVSWLYRNDPTKSAKDLGYAYLPQEVVDDKTFDEYVAQLDDSPLTGVVVDSSLESDDKDCPGGVCPAR